MRVNHLPHLLPRVEHGSLSGLYGMSDYTLERARALFGSETQPDILAHDLDRELGLRLDQAHRLIAEADADTPMSPPVPDWPMRQRSAENPNPQPMRKQANAAYGKK